MVRNLYRFYLYAVCLALLVFATVALGHLLQIVLAFTPLRGSSASEPGSAETIQAIVLFVISWLIAVALGGFHYRLIRRDIKDDPAAGGSAIRAFFLNIAEGIAVVVAVALSGVTVIPSLGQAYAGDITSLAAASLALLGLAAVLEWERRRIPVGSATARLFEHLHLYGTQLLLLLLLSFSWMGTVHQLVDALVSGGQGMISVGGPAPCGGFTACQGSNLLSLTAALLWIALFWIGYGLLAREDAPSLFRQILHYASLAAGFGLILYGCERGIELLMRALFGVPVSLLDVVSPAGSYDFVSPLLLGMLVTGVYSLWLALAGRKEPQGQVKTLLIGEAIAASLLAAVFWWGIGLALYSLLQSIAGVQVSAADWAAASALVITGAGYAAFEWFLRRRSMHEPTVAAAPRRGMVLALLGAGVLAAAVGLAVALYSLATFLLGSPINDWGQLTRMGLSAGVVGALVAAFYLWRLRDEKLALAAVGQPASQAMTLPVAATASVPPPATPEAAEGSSSIEAILDDLLAGKISRDEAAARLHRLFHLQPAPS